MIRTILQRKSSRLVAPLAFFVLLAMAPAALATVAQEQRQGARILGQIDSGQRSCDQSLQTTDFERVGEYVMGRMAGSTGTHQSMNATMARSMGTQREEQMHVALGQRFTGCGSATGPASFGRMMGAMGIMGGSRGGYSPGGMMGGANRSDGNDHTDWAAVGLGALAGGLLGALIAVALSRRRPLGGHT